MKKIAVTFSGGSYSLKISQIRLEQQLKQYFDGVASFDENHPLIIKYMHLNPQVFKYRRGFGYWAWKSFVIKAALDAVDLGDYIFYIDSGNDIIKNPSRLFELCTENDGFMLFENRSGNTPPDGDGSVNLNDRWTKMDCFNKMNCADIKYYKGQQADGAYQLYQKNLKTINFINEYNSYSTDPAIITDEPNLTGSNFSSFVDHRHDQSILSLLAIKYNIKTYPQPSEVGNWCSEVRSTYGYDQIFWHHRGTIYGRR